VLSLMLNDGLLVNSRRFVLNNVAEVGVMKQYLNPDSVDEIAIVDVSRRPSVALLCEKVREIVAGCFVPVSVGGGVRTFEDAQLIFKNGGDKIIVNTLFYLDRSVLAQIRDTYGKQSIVLSLDLQKIGGEYIGCHTCGTVNSGVGLLELLREAEEFGVGEILVRSMDRDGVGQGYDTELLRLAVSHTTIPVVAAGGVGNFHHLGEGIDLGAQAVSVGNLFHFVGERLSTAKAIINDSMGTRAFPPAWNH